jgi:hypothetical protein
MNTGYIPEDIPDEEDIVLPIENNFRVFSWLAVIHLFFLSSVLMPDGAFQLEEDQLGKIIPYLILTTNIVFFINLFIGRGSKKTIFSFLFKLISASLLFTGIGFLFIEKSQIELFYSIYLNYTLGSIIFYMTFFLTQQILIKIRR